MNALDGLVTAFGLAMLRYLPVFGIPALSPLSWAPGMVRLVLLLAASWLTVLASGVLPAAGLAQPMALVLACLGELLLGLAFGLAILLPQAAIGFAARLADTQAGLSAASLFNPGGQHEPESIFGTIFMLAATVLFFSLDLHLRLFGLLTSSVRAIPLGSAGANLDFEGFLSMVSSSFLLGLAVVSPVILGLFAVDMGVAYATRSMPQANVYFLALPLKVGLALLLLAATLAFAPVLVGRLYGDAFNRIPALIGR